MSCVRMVPPFDAEYALVSEWYSLETFFTKNIGYINDCTLYASMLSIEPTDD